MPMNYYDEVLEKLENLRKEKKDKEAYELINEELSQPYVPADFQQKLQEILSTLSVEEESRSLSDEQIESYLYDSEEKQLYAVRLLSEKNLRSYFEVIDAFLRDDDASDPAKIYLTDALIRQEVSDEYTLHKNGVEYVFIPRYQLPIEESDGFVKAQKILDAHFFKEPSRKSMAKQLLIFHCMENLPLNYEEDEGGPLAEQIIEEIEESFAEPLDRTMLN